MEIFHLMYLLIGIMMMLIYNAILKHFDADKLCDLVNLDSLNLSVL